MPRAREGLGKKCYWVRSSWGAGSSIVAYPLVTVWAPTTQSVTLPKVMRPLAIPPVQIWEPWHSSMDVNQKFSASWLLTRYHQDFGPRAVVWPQGPWVKESTPSQVVGSTQLSVAVGWWPWIPTGGWLEPAFHSFLRGPPTHHWVLYLLRRYVVKSVMSASSKVKPQISGTTTGSTAITVTFWG